MTPIRRIRGKLTKIRVFRIGKSWPPISLEFTCRWNTTKMRFYQFLCLLAYQGVSSWGQKFPSGNSVYWIACKFPHSDFFNDPTYGYENRQNCWYYEGIETWSLWNESAQSGVGLRAITIWWMPLKQNSFNINFAETQQVAGSLWKVVSLIISYQSLHQQVESSTFLSIVLLFRTYVPSTVSPLPRHPPCVTTRKRYPTPLITPRPTYYLPLH